MKKTTELTPGEMDTQDRFYHNRRIMRKKNNKQHKEVMLNKLPNELREEFLGSYDSHTPDFQGNLWML